MTLSEYLTESILSKNKNVYDHHITVGDRVRILTLKELEELGLVDKETVSGSVGRYLSVRGITIYRVMQELMGEISTVRKTNGNTVELENKFWWPIDMIEKI